MTTKVFIPITDELMYEYPELITSPLKPYQVEQPCFHWSASIETMQGKIFRQVNSRQELVLHDAIINDAASLPQEQKLALSIWGRMMHRISHSLQQPNL